MLKNVTGCSQYLTNVGFDVREVDNPAELSLIRNPVYRELVLERGCCGSAEFLKLLPFTLTEYDIVIGLDADMFFSQPFDDLFDAMLVSDPPVLPDMPHRRDLPPQVDFFFTRDYFETSLDVAPDHNHFGVQGGFFVARPNTTRYREMLKMVLEGNFTRSGGWGELRRYGGYHGSPQIQGFMSYYWGAFYPDLAVELNHCVYNSLGNIPPVAVDECKDPERQQIYATLCKDCREVPVTDIKLHHFAGSCYKPYDVSMDGLLQFLFCVATCWVCRFLFSACPHIPIANHMQCTFGLAPPISIS